MQRAAGEKEEERKHVRFGIGKLEEGSEPTKRTEELTLNGPKKMFSYSENEKSWRIC